LRRVTGLARSTLTYKIDAPLAAGYLVEDSSIVDGRGRPSTRLRINDQVTTILVADLGATHGRLAVGTPAGDVLVESVIESSIGKGPDAVLLLRSTPDQLSCWRFSDARSSCRRQTLLLREICTRPSGDTSMRKITSGPAPRACTTSARATREVTTTTLRPFGHG
jgi:hypothetical protein